MTTRYALHRGDCLEVLPTLELDAHFYAVARERLEAAAAKAATPLFPDGPGDGFLPGVVDAPGVHE
jgi:hypothetical protein